MPVTFLIDTGSNVTILKKDLVDQLPSDVCHTIQPTHMKLLTVTGEVAPFLGKVTLNVEIGSILSNKIFCWLILKMTAY